MFMISRAQLSTNRLPRPPVMMTTTTPCCMCRAVCVWHSKENLLHELFLYSQLSSSFVLALARTVNLRVSPAHSLNIRTGSLLLLHLWRVKNMSRNKITQAQVTDERERRARESSRGKSINVMKNLDERENSI